MKSIRLRKLKIVLIVAFLVLLISAAWGWIIQTKASTTVEYNLKIVRLRPDSGLAYNYLRSGSLTDNWIKIWNLVNVNNGQNEELPLYCVQAELGFYLSAGNEGTVTYNKAFNMKLKGDKTDLNNTYGTSKLIIAQNENDDIYSSVLWLADNMYVPNQDSKEEKIALLEKAGVINKSEYTGYTIDIKKQVLNALKKDGIIKEDIESLSNEQIDTLFYAEWFVSDDVIEVVQQLAYWYIVHSKETDDLYKNYHKEELPNLYVATEENADNPNGYKLLENYGDDIVVRVGNDPLDGIYTKIGKEYQRNAKTLYAWFINQIKANGASYYDKVAYEQSPYKDGEETTVSVKINSTSNTVKVEETEDNYYLVGPYEVERVSTGKFSLVTTISAQKYEILDSQKQKVNTVEDVVQDAVGKYIFYLKIPKTENISNLKTTFNVKSNNRLVTLLLGDNAESEQPVLLVENKPAEKTFVVNVALKGSFKFKLTKYVEGVSGIALKDAKFTVSIKDGDEELVPETNKLYTTNKDGIFEIPDLEIKGAGKTYKVTVTEVIPPEGYEGLDGPITFEATTQIKNGNSYALVSSEEGFSAENAKKVQINEGEILVEAENAPKGPHKGVKEVDNQDSGYNGDEEQEWVIQTTIPSELNKYGKYIITDPIDEKLVYQKIKSVKLLTQVDGEPSETILNENEQYKQNYDEATKTLTVTFIDKANKFDGGKSLTPGGIVEIRFNTKFALNEDGSIKALDQSVPNQAKLIYGNDKGEEKELLTEKPEVHTGKAGVYKYNEATKVALAGATFKIAKTEADAKAGIFVKNANGEDMIAISGSDGYAWFYGLEFGEDAMNKVAETVKDPITGADVYKYDWEKVQTKYYIVETEAPAGFNQTDEIIEVVVKKDGGKAEEVKNQNSIANNPNKGTFKLKLTKYVEGISDITLQGAGFKVSVKDENNKELVENPKKVYTTNKNGIFEITNLDIDKAGKKYTITITETVVPEGYEGLKGAITFTATSKLSDDGKSYILEAKTPKVTNAKKVEIKAGQILIEAENKPEGPHKGVKDVLNQSSGYNGDEKHEWVIQTKIPSEIEKYGKYVITDKIDERLVFAGKSSVKVKILDGKDLVKDTDYKVSYNKDTKVLKVSFIEGDFVKGKELAPGSIVEIRFNTTFALDEKGNIIALNQSVPNQAELTYGNDSGEEKSLKTEKPEIHTGQAGIFKYNEETKIALAGAKFKIATSKENAEKGIFVKDANGKDIEVTSGEDGYAWFYGLEFGEDALNKAKYKTKDETTGADVFKYDWTKVETKYYIVETEAPEGFNKTNQIIQVTVKKDFKEVIEIDDAESIANSSIKGLYKIFINKKDEADNYLSEVFFETTGTDSAGKSLEDDIEKSIETTGTENAKQIVSREITKENVSLKDTYTITETKTKEGYYKLKAPITVEVEKELKNREYIVSKFTVNGEEVLDSKTLDVELVDTDKKATILFTRKDNTLEIVVENISIEKIFDLALRKVIIEVADKDGNIKSIVDINEKGNEREIIEDTSNLYKTVDGKLQTTAEYKHRKDPVLVETGDIVTYKIIIYNEGQAIGRATKIVDCLPEGIEFVEVVDGDYTATQKNRWIVLEKNGKDNLDAFDGEKLDSESITIKCRVTGKPSGENKVLTNIAFIYEEYNEETDTSSTEQKGLDIDSEPSDFPNEVVTGNASDYKGDKSNDDDLSKPDYFYEGEEDDDDFEKLVLKEEGIFDLALRKFITKVDDGENVKSYEESRTPVVTKGTGKRDLDYTHPKDPIGVQNGNLVTYTIRVYNEGEEDGYAKEVTDSIPDGLQFYSATVDGEDYRWVMYKEVTDNSTYDFEYEGKKYVKTTNKEEAKLIKTDYLSKAQETATGRDNLLKAFDASDFNKNGTIDTKTKRNPDYRDLKVTFKVTEPNTSSRILTNIAEITKHEDKDGDEKVIDKDSTPGNGGYDFEDNDKNEDDIDFDRVKLLCFDFALRKFITEVEGVPVNNRYPKVKPGTKGRDFDYEHTKEPVDVISGDTVIYTIRVYNEGPNAGYVSEVMDDLPDGIIFLSEHETNLEYRWVMYKEATSVEADYEYAGKKYVKTNNAEEADIIATDYLSKEVSEKAGRDSLLKAYDESKGITENNPDYRDLKVAFKVTEPNSSDRIIVNTAEITKNQDEDGNEKIKDKDSTPGNGEKGKDEDDIDKEYIKVKEFDLALLKWVSEVSVTQDGKTTITKTGHTAETSRNEDPVLVTIDSKKIDSVVVKFIYDIRVENQGQIEGYAKEIKDHIPDGLVFKQEDNPDWTQIDEKTIVTDALKDTLLKPKETATVRVVLTWVNGSKNLNQKTNYAEISKDYNDWGVPDKDSEPNNWDTTPGEDDDDDAPVLLTLKTGQLPVYFILGFGVLIVLAGGVYLIRKYVYNA